MSRSALLAALCVPLVKAAEPECSLNQCLWKPDNYKFGDARFLVGNYGREGSQLKAGQPYNFLQPSLCSPQNWRSYTQCLERCPVAIVITSPANISMRACMQMSDFNPYAPNQHIDSNHPLNGRELDFIQMAKPGMDEREACDLPGDENVKNYTNKIVVVKRGGCYFSTKGRTVNTLGGLFALVVDYSSATRPAFFPTTMGGGSSGFENTPSAMMAPHMGDIILNALDAGIPVKGHVSLDCDVMSAPPPDPLEIPENCPSTSLFGMCDDMESEEDQLCSRCGVQLEFQNAQASTTSTCLYNHLLVPTAAKNSLVTLGGPDINEEMHLGTYIPDFLPDPNCADNSVDSEPLTGNTCQDIADLINNGQMSSCAFLLQEGFPAESTSWFLQNCYVTCPRPVGGVGCLGGTGEGCEARDFVNAVGKILALKRPSACTHYQMVRHASDMGVKAVIILADDNAGATPVFVDGLSKFVNIPLHALDYDGSRAFEAAALKAYNSNPSSTNIAVKITQKAPAPPPVRTPGPTQPPERLAGLEGSSEFQWTDTVIIAVVIGALLLILNIYIFVNQRMNSIELPRQSSKKGGGLKIPLSAASTGLSLSLLMTIAVVAFSLAYKAGNDTTNSALDDGWSAVEKTHGNAVLTVSQLKDQLMKTIVARVGQGVVAGLEAGELSAQYAAKMFLISDGSWEDFDSRIWQLTEFSRGASTSSLWKMTVRTTKGFFAAQLLKTDDRPNASRGETGPWAAGGEWTLDGLPHVSVSQDGTLYGVNFMTYRAGGNIVREHCPRRQFDPSISLGRQWLDANAVMKGKPDGSVYCYTTQQTIPVQQYVSFEYGLRPLSCLSPIYDKDGGFLGTAEAHTGTEWFGALLGRSAASPETQNMTIVVFNEKGEFVTSSKGRNNRIVDNYGSAYTSFTVSALNYGDSTFTDAITAPIVLEYAQEPYLNAAANYMKGVMGLGTPGNVAFDFAALKWSSGAGEFDQQEYYGKGLSTRFVQVSFDFDQMSTADTSGMGWEAELKGSGGRYATGARGSSHALEFDGGGWLQMSMYLTPMTPRVAAGDNPAYNDTMPDPSDPSKRIVGLTTYDNYYGYDTFPLLKEPLIASTFSLSMWVKPRVAVDDNPLTGPTSARLFSDTLNSGSWKFRMFANGKMMLTEWADTGAFGCETKPIVGGPPAGEWTHITAVVDRNYLATDAALAGKPVSGVQSCRVFVNGVLHDSKPMGSGLIRYDAMLPNAEPYYFGQHFDGALDEITFFNSTLSAGDITSIMDKGPLAYDKDVPSKRWYVQVKEEKNFNLTWGVAALIPRADIMRTVDLLNELQRQNQTILRQNTNNKLEQNLAEVMLIVVAIALASVAIFLVFNEMLTRPFALFARQMTDVACMKVEDVETDTASSLREIDSMHNAMTLMVRNLKEYKSYMPQTMLQMNEDEEEEESKDGKSSLSASGKGTAKDSAARSIKSKMSSNRSSMQQSVVSTNLAKARKQEAAVKVGALNGKRCSFLAANVSNFIKCAQDKGKIVPTHTKLIETILGSCAMAKGVPDTFCGDRIFCSFNAVRPVSGYRLASVTAAHRARSKVDSDENMCQFPISFAVVTGECQVGNMGTDTMRRFSFHSSVVPWSVALERYQRTLECRGCIDGPTKEEASNGFAVRLVDAPIYPKRKADQVLRVFEVLQALASAEEEEWMYQLEKAESSDPHA
eukprot:Hpha_TRINITY_DN16380_c2_g10::TRINITY_DN16380_c2_g10_i1::g.62818::m.62818